MSADIAEFILPLNGIRNKLTPTMIHFLVVHEIFLHGALEECLRLALSSDTRFDSNMLVHHISYVNIRQIRTTKRDAIHPAYSDAEATDLYTRCITLIYDNLYQYLWLATRPLYRITDAVNVTITKHRYLDDSVYIKAEVDYLPF
jgi:hypothetical protein